MPPYIYWCTCFSDVWLFSHTITRFSLKSHSISLCVCLHRNKKERYFRSADFLDLYDHDNDSSNFIIYYLEILPYIICKTFHIFSAGVHYFFFQPIYCAGLEFSLIVDKFRWFFFKYLPLRRLKIMKKNPFSYTRNLGVK